MHNFVLTIDSGNTKTSCALFETSTGLISTFSSKQLTPQIEKYNLSQENTLTLLSNVRSEKIDIPMPFIDVKNFFKDNKFFEMPVNYNKTIGIDRLLTSFAIYNNRNNSYLCIDAGTFTTMDFVDVTGFSGGYILPGFGTIINSYALGSNLSPPERVKWNARTPQSTVDALGQGAIISFIAPILSIIDEKKPSNIVVTGGDGDYLYEILKEKLDISIHFEKNLIHNSLFKIAQLMQA